MLSIVIPAYNEEENIAAIIDKIENSVGINHELVVVNDYSKDRTAQIVMSLAGKYPNLRLLDNAGDKGFAGAVKFGLNSINGDRVVLVMGDLCDDLNTIKDMNKKMDEGFDIVCGSRYIKGGRRLGGSKLKGTLSAFAGWSLHYLLGIPTHDIANAFKMYRKDVIKNINIESDTFQISMEIPLKAHYKGFKIAEVPTAWKERDKGKSSFKVFKLIPKYLKLYFWAIGKRLSRGMEKKT